ncbi:MAG TPA: hypothetical protein VFU89_02110 [Rhabdochlamydiaceae bacterium]|nr:hypothetical protein [Rhabdochlamydiaceae bacterium]
MVSLTGLGLSYYSYGPSMLCVLVPSIASALFRSTFESKCTHLLTNKRQFAYFLLNSFIPTAFALCWHAFDWKVILVASTILTIAAKYFSDKALPSSPNKSARKSSKRHEKVKEQQLDIVDFTRSNSLIPRISYPLLAQAKSMPAETLFKSLIPGDYQVTIEGNVISINEKKIENEFKFWVRKLPEHDLNLQDIDQLQKRIRYRDLDVNQRKGIRKSIYQSLFPLIHEKSINLSFMTGYNGEAVSLRQENSQLVVRFESNRPFEILINENGTTCFKYYANKEHHLKSVNTATQEVVYEYPPPQHLSQNPPIKLGTTAQGGSWEVSVVSESVCYFSMEGDENNQPIIKLFHNARYENDKLLIPEASDRHLSPERLALKTESKKIIDYALHKSRSCLELLNFKMDEVVAFLETGSKGQAEKAFQGCYTALSSFQEGINSLTESTASTSLVNHNDNIEKSSYRLGPMWSPVAASEDSSFTWHMTTDRKTDEISLRFEKSFFRGMMGGKGEREITITKGRAPNLLTIEIFKSNENDLQHGDSISKYSIENLEGLNIYVTPLGRETNESCLPFILGMSFYQKNTKQIQLPEQIQTDMGFIMKVLSTLRDIQSSPDTLILDKSRHLICDLQGNPVPTERIKQLSNYSQEGSGHPLVRYEPTGYQEGRQLRWGTYAVSNSPTTALLANHPNRTLEAASS